MSINNFLNMSVLIVKMEGGPFRVLYVTHRRFRQFLATRKVFDTQYE